MHREVCKTSCYNTFASPRVDFSTSRLRKTRYDNEKSLPRVDEKYSWCPSYKNALKF